MMIEGDQLLEVLENEERQAQEMVLKHQANQDAETAELMRQVKEDEESYMAMAKKTDRRETEHRERIRKTLAEEDKIERKKLSEYLKFQDDVKMANIKAALIEVEEKDLDADKIIAEIEKLHAEERERLKVYVAEDEAILRKYIECHQLDLSYISEEMKKVMAEDRMMDDFIQNTDKEMQKMFKQVRDNVADENKSAMERVSELEKDKASLMQMILEDEALQKQMFITTQQDQDKVYQALTGEIENVQENLMLLTMLEKHQLDMDDAAKEHIWSQRAEMAHLLTDLVKKQEERRHELEEAAKLIETQYQDELANFWLYQYQMLMASKPVQIIREEEEAMRAAHKVREIEGEMKQSNDVYPTPMTLPPAWSEGPSAPAPDAPPNKEPSAPRSGPTPAPDTPPDKEPSAPRSGPTPAPKPLDIQTEPTSKPLGIQTGIESETECCICLDNVPNVAFLPCGHVCCCEACGIVSICPMCRAEITNTIKLYFTQN